MERNHCWSQNHGKFTLARAVDLYFEVTNSIRLVFFQGLPSELTLVGTVRAKFNETSNKITAVTMYYDTGALRFQLSRSLR